MIQDVWGDLPVSHPKFQREDPAMDTASLPDAFIQRLNTEYTQGGCESILKLLPQRCIDDIQRLFSNDTPPAFGITISQDTLIACILLAIVGMILYDVFKRAVSS